VLAKAAALATLAACGQEVTIDMVAHAMPGISRNLERSFGHPVVVARDGFPVYVGVTQHQLARKFNVTRAFVCDVVRGKSWKHLPLR